MVLVIGVRTKIEREGCRSPRVVPGGRRAHVSKRPCDLHLSFISIFTAEEEGKDELSQDKRKDICSLKAWFVAANVALRRELKECDRGWTWRKGS